MDTMWAVGQAPRCSNPDSNGLCFWLSTNMAHPQLQLQLHVIQDLHLWYGEVESENPKILFCILGSFCGIVACPAGENSTPLHYPS
eukprot:m.8399 g.8399  ORF g.8399 m.8399 type:complete len:86 (-) comp4056_c0_seq1:825-1082(-)